MRKLFQQVACIAVATGAFFAHGAVIEYDLPDVSNYNSTNAINNWFSTGAISEDIESFTLSLFWRDQGWGNRKGRLRKQV